MCKVVLESMRGNLIIRLNEDAIVKFLNPLAQDRRGTGGFGEVGHCDLDEIDMILCE